MTEKEQLDAIQYYTNAYQKEKQKVNELHSKLADLDAKNKDLEFQLNRIKEKQNAVKLLINQGSHGIGYKYKF